MADNHFFIVLASLILVYFLWMDLALYYKLQSGWGDLLVVQTYENLNVSSGPPSDSSSIGGAAAAPSTHRQISSSSLSSSSSSSAPTTMAFFDPFNPISVKLLMVDHANHYIYYSLTWWIDTHLLHIADKLLFISPDMISMSHVAVAACGARLIVSDSIYYRRIGVVLFEMRSMLDSYDGMVARARAHKRALTQANGGWGYWMDGICDAIGTVLFFVGAWVLLQKRRGSLAGVPRRRSIGIGNGLSSKKSSSSSSLESLHKPTSSSSPSSCNPVSPSSALSMSTLTVRASASTDNLIAMEEEASPFIASPSSPSSSAVHHCYGEGGGGGGAAGVMRAATVTVLALLGQQFISSLLWNRYMHGFHELLEVPYKVRREQENRWRAKKNQCLQPQLPRICNCNA